MGITETHAPFRVLASMKRSALTLDSQIFQIFLYLKIIKLRGVVFG